MKKLAISFVMLLFVSFGLMAQVDRSKFPAAGPAPEIKIKDAETFTLANGLKVFVVNNTKLPRVSFTLVLERDPILEKDKAGMSSFVGEMMMGGTTNRTKDHHIAGFEGPAHGGTGFDEGCHVRPVGLVHRRGHGHDEDIGLCQFIRLAGVAQATGLGQLCALDLQRAVYPFLEFGDATRVNVKTNNGTLFAKLYCQRQTDISQADNGQFHILKLQLHSPVSAMRKE